jgi:hypothetical protein
MGPSAPREPFDRRPAGERGSELDLPFERGRPSSRRTHGDEVPASQQLVGQKPNKCDGAPVGVGAFQLLQEMRGRIEWCSRRQVAVERSNDVLALTLAVRTVLAIDSIRTIRMQRVVWA